MGEKSGLRARRSKVCARRCVAWQRLGLLHALERKRPGDVPGRPTGALRDVGEPSEAQQGDREVPDGRGSLGCSTCAHAGEILAKGLVAHVVVAVLYRPVPADVGCELRGSRLFAVRSVK